MVLVMSALVLAALLLEGAAGRGAGLFLGAAQDPGGRRGRRAVELGQRVRGDGRGAALHAALPRAG
ncbi:MAG: hypothetical protein MZV70_28815 [Desulfobacterales bacterium]|nr:hypothetical protein [Desulfobacterales bacterium]